jgi:TrbL/VirB6 plasmid conjugal transfer protein
VDILASIFEQFIAGLQGGTDILTTYGIAILAGAAFVYATWYLVQGSYVMSSGAGLGDVLASFLLLGLGIGIYTWVVTNWRAMTQAALDAMLFWASAGAGAAGAELLNGPASLWELGQRVVAPIAFFSEWERSIGSITAVVISPITFLAWVTILAAFFWLVLNVGMALVEWWFAVCVGVIMLPLAYLRPVEHFAEMTIGWLAATGVRIFTLCLLAAIMVPMIEGIVPEPTTGAPAAPAFSDPMSGVPMPGLEEAPKMGQTLALLAASSVFALLAWLIPSRVSRLAGGMAMGLGASEVVGAAMTAGRFGMMIGTSIFSPVSSRVFSPMLKQIRG